MTAARADYARYNVQHWSTFSIQHLAAPWVRSAPPTVELYHPQIFAVLHLLLEIAVGQGHHTSASVQ